MNTQDKWAIASASPSQIEAIVRRARAERAAAMRAAIVRLPALFKRLAAAVWPNRQRQTHAAFGRELGVSRR